MPSGRPFKATREQRQAVETMAAVGITQDEIATVLGIQRRALARHFRDELDRGAIKADAKVLGTLYKMATSGQHPAATIFWAKVRRRWRERDDDAPTATVSLVIRRGEAEPSTTEPPAPGGGSTT